MIAVRAVNNNYFAHVFIICEICKVEIDIMNIGCYEDICEKNGWNKKTVYDINAEIGEKYKIFHWCEKCSLEYLNKN